MVSLKDVRASNARFKEKATSGMVALFVGGTSGVGKGTLIRFAKNATAPRVYLVGRSKVSATPLLNELETLNPNGTFTFIETQISLIKNVDRVCDEIKAKEQKLDIIFLSTGYLTMEGRQETSEGIEILTALNYYTRLRAVNNLLPLLSKAPTPRVISIFAGGKERGLDLNDLELHNNPPLKLRFSTPTTMTTLSFEHLAQQYPNVTFCHMYPGFVNTGQLDRFMLTAKGLWRVPAEVARWTLIPLISLLARSVDVAGEMGLFVATSAKYPASEGKEAGVELPKGVKVAKSSDVKDGKGNGVYRLDENGESVQNECDQVLEKYREEGVRDKVWKETIAIWERALKRDDTS